MIVDVKRVKIAVFVPRNAVSAVQKAMCEAGAGIIGNYSCCTSSTKCKGTFLPNESANPSIGKRGKATKVSEVKLEAVCTIEKCKSVLCAIRAVHPYEEPAIDVYPLIDESAL